ncbi:ABC transporter permease [Paenibacillus thermotolerans]|uniref:ABC transporter permease n=1 Tax=Paenibacillus thermotolerans TaxID=3027807 RepID=UPI00236812B0|nr:MULTISPECIES: FtsX-like permease family protein [unclassified Paenibacillus]
MKLSDKLRFVRQNMKRHRTRLFMTILAAAMGCGFLIDLASIGFGLQKSIVDEIVGDRLVTEIEVHGKEQGDRGAGSLTEHDLDYLSSVANVKAVTHRAYLQQSVIPVVDGVKGLGGSAVVLDIASEQKTGFPLSAGTMPANKQEALIGPHFRAQFMNPDEGSGKPEAVPDAAEWIGKTVSFTLVQTFPSGNKEQTYQVKIVGVTEKPTKEWMSDNYLYIGSDLLDEIEAFTQTRYGRERTAEEDNAQDELNEPRPLQQVKVYADHVSHVKQIAETIRKEGYYNHSIANELENVNMVFFVLKLGLFFVGTIAVLIASIGIYNTMTMAVSERAQDIGIMKAIGAHPRTIRGLFMLESGMIGCWGALIGIAAAYAISAGANFIVPYIIESFMNEKPPASFVISHIPLYLTIGCAVLSIAVAVFSGMRPAARATRVDVLSALRRDI